MGSRLKFHSLSVVVVLALVLCETLVESQYYVAEESREPPVIVVNSDDGSVLNPFASTDGRSFSVSQANDDEQTVGRGFSSRAGLARRMESDEDDDESEEVQRPVSSKKRRRNSNSRPRDTGRSRPINLPPGFDDRVRKRMKMDRRTKTPLHGDPNPIDEDDEEGRQPESRLLWPFSIEITKGAKDKGGWGHGGGPGGYGSYHEWLANNHHHYDSGWSWGPVSGWTAGGPNQYGAGPNQYGSGPGVSHPYGWKPGDLTDEEILNSKHYKKYRKKKKKKIKKLKKKLKFKRLVQKILQKHITYLDKIAPY